MHSTLSFLSFALTVFPGAIVASNLDVNDSAVQNFTKTTASAIVKTYKDQLAIPGGVLGVFQHDGGFWRETGDIWATLLEYSQLTGDTQFNDVITSGMIHQTGEKIVAFMPENQTRVLSNEAQAAWGLAALNAAESNLTMPKRDKMETDKWIDLAKAVFETQVDRWSDKLCLGGLNNQIFPLNLGYDILGSDPNGEFFLLAARLARFTGNSTYSEWAETSYNWAETVGIVNKDYRVRYGLSESKNCSFITEVVDQAMNHATYTEATAIMYNITNGTDKSDKWESAVAGFANSSSAFLQDGKFYASSCATNGTAKCTEGKVDSLILGPTILSYARAVKAAPQTAEKLQKILNASAHNFSLSWAGIPTNSSGKSVDEDNGIKVISEAYGNLSIALALLEPNQKASGSNSTDSKESGGAPSNGANPNTNESGANEQLRASLGLIFGIAASVLLVL